MHISLYSTTVGSTKLLWGYLEKHYPEEYQRLEERKVRNVQRTLPDGTNVKAYTHDDPLQREQNVKLLNLIQRRALPNNFGESREVKEWAESMDPRTTPAGGETIGRMSLAKREVIETKKTIMYRDMKERGQRMSCQLDMMSKNGISFAVMNVAYIEEIHDSLLGFEKGSLRKAWKVETDVLDFEEFPENEHTGENIFKWAKSTVEKFDLELSDFVVMCPDGASNCRAAMALMRAKATALETPICNIHQIARSVLKGAGLQGSLANSENDDLRRVLEKHRRLSGKVHKSPHQGKKLEEVAPILDYVITMS